jgi:membrane protein YdbS with pleckstrin-like domain
MDDERTKNEIIEDVKYYKRVLRGLEVVFVIIAIIAIINFIMLLRDYEMAAYLVSYTLCLAMLLHIWKKGEVFEFHKWLDELRLKQKKDE